MKYIKFYVSILSICTFRWQRSKAIVLESYALCKECINAQKAECTLKVTAITRLTYIHPKPLLKTPKILPTIYITRSAIYRHSGIISVDTSQNHKDKTFQQLSATFISNGTRKCVWALSCTIILMNDADSCQNVYTLRSLASVNAPQTWMAFLATHAPSKSCIVSDSSVDRVEHAVKPEECYS